MDLQLNLWQRMNLGAVIGMSTGNIKDTGHGLALIDIFSLNDEEKTQIGIVLEGKQEAEINEKWMFDIHVPEVLEPFLKKVVSEFEGWPRNQNVQEIAEQLGL